jgi:hypothetical protein
MLKQAVMRAVLRIPCMNILGGHRSGLRSHPLGGSLAYHRTRQWPDHHA